MSRLHDKFTLITGGTSGIGLETARQFLAQGARVAITGRSEQGLEAARKVLGEAALLIKSNAGDVDDQHLLARKIAEQWPRLDAVYINAADVTHQPLQQWDEAAFDRVMAVNLKGPLFLIQRLVPLLANPASVILCSSAAAHIGLPQSSVYAASKAALLSLARTLSAELRQQRIRVNCLTPGPTETPALKKLGLPPAEEEKLRHEIRDLVPIQRMGSPYELAMAAVFLASDESQFVVGTELQVDGGVSNL